MCLVVFQCSWLALAGASAQALPLAAPSSHDAAHWQAVAAADLDAVHALVKSAHPGWLDAENPRFRRWAEDGYVEATTLLPKVSSYDTALAAVRFYVTGFKDGHFSYSDNTRPRGTTQLLAGWLVADVNGTFIVTAVMPDWPAPLPPRGARLLGCDGRTPSQLIAEKIAPFIDRRDIPDVRASLAGDLGSLMFPGAELKRCTFSTDAGKALILPVVYQPVDAYAAYVFHRDASGAVQDASARRNTATFRDGTLWIHAQNFMPDEKGAAALKVMLETIAQYQGVQRIVFDTRGNGGGNSGVGQRIFDAATGGLVYDEEHLDRLPRFHAQWRVSDTAIDKIRQQTSQIGAMYGAGSDEMRFFATMDKKLRDAKAAGEDWVDQDGGPSLTRQEMRRRHAHLRRFSGTVALITDANCASACLDFADAVLRVPGALHLGKTTSSDTVYIDVAVVVAPSGNNLWLPVKVWRNRPRGDSEPLVPGIVLDVDMHDDDAVYRAATAALDHHSVKGDVMEKQLRVIVEDDETMSIDGRRLSGRDELVDALKSAVASDPGVVLVIAPESSDNYHGIGKVIYASQYAGVPPAQLRYTMADGTVVTPDEMQSRNRTTPE